MAGRGRGKGALSFNVEALGIQHGEALPGPVLQPPPCYPVLETVTAPMFPSLKCGQTLQFKKDFLNFYSKLKVDIEEVNKLGTKRRFDSTVAPKQNAKDRPQLNYDWNRFPMELRPGITKKPKNIPKVKIKSMADIDKMLAQLEQKENSMFNANESVVKQEKVKDEENEGEDGAVEEEIEHDSDQEMDIGTDYNSNYFDNGESYLDDDDDADEGPVY